MIFFTSLLLLASATVPVFGCAGHAKRAAAAPIVRRDSPSGQCGAANSGYTCTGTSTNRCCSEHGWCGDTKDHCGTGCQAAYGECSAPTPAPTLPPITPRTKVGSVPYGADIYACTKLKTIALTFDDGPYEYTAQLLDILKAKGVKATFFITGSNLDKGNIDSVQKWISVIQRMYAEGHQVASHTWSHADLSAVDDTTRRYEVIRNEQAFMSILGRYPTYIRPPYINCNDACKTTLGELGYHVILWDLDTDDYNNLTPQLIQNSKNLVTQAYSERWDAYMSIAHDIHPQTVSNLTGWQIDAGKAIGYTHVTLGECLGDPAANWYRTKL